MSELSILADHALQVAHERRRPAQAPSRPVVRPRVLMCGEVECYDGASIQGRGSATALERFDPLDYEPTQPAKIPVLHLHARDRVIGDVEYLSWGTGPARIFAVCSIDADAADEWAADPAFFSPGTRRRSGTGRLVLDHLGLVRATARIAAAPVRWPGSGWDGRSLWTRQTTPGYELLTRADAAVRRRPTDAGIPIVGHPEFADLLEEQRHTARGQGEDRRDMPDYMRKNGEGGLFYSGGVGWIVK